jgi:glycosyltransferase involved in cell wall biosynthesis
MKIVLTNDAKDISGGENFVLFLARGLRELGHEVILCPLVGSDLEEASRERGFRTMGIPYGAGGKEFAATKNLVRTLRSEHVDIIHTNSNFDRTIGAVASWFLGCRSIASIHSCFSIRRNFTHAVRNRFLIDHFVPDGYSTSEILQTVDGISPRKITVIHDAIPEDEIRYSAEARKALRQEWQVAEHDLVIGNIGRLSEFKGQTHIIDAAQQLTAENASLKFVIVGEGELRRSLEQQTAQVGLENTVIFPGYRTDLPALLSAFDIYIQPSLDRGGETFPLAVISAAAASLPVIASDVGDIKYMVRHEQNGLLISPADSDGLAHALRQLINHPELRRQYGDASRNIFLKTLSLPAMVREFEKVYSGVLTRPHS